MEQEIRSGSAEFGQLLRRYRLAAGLSQEALAERARMSTEGISALERGYRRSPQRETLELLAGALALDDEQRRDFESAARAGVARRAGSASVTVGPWPETGAAALPIALTTYVGREGDMASIAALLRESRLVTLTGAGGVGKTRAALHAAGALDDEWEYPPRFVSLASAVDGVSVVQSIAAALGVQEVPNHSLRETLQSYLRGKAMLLILDNCEHVIDAAAELAESFLAGCPRVRILATSREPLRVAGEHAYRLPSLAIPSPGESHALTAAEAVEYGAVRLFVDRARAVNHRFELTDEQVSNVAELCRHLDGIPLAIELAAARVNALSLRELNERLGERFRLLTGGERTASPRQQTMRATIDWSYNLLSPPERQLFERLSVFAGACTVAAAARVDAEGAREADVLDLLTALAHKSLVVADLNGDETRYRLLESFREYAREKLAARGETDALARRHALVCLEIARAYNRAADANLDELFRPKIASELENWRAALEWTLTAQNDVVLGQELAAELVTVWHTFAPVEGRRWLALAEQAGGPTPPAILAALSLAQADVALLLGNSTAQLAYSRAALSYYRGLSDPLGIAQAQARVGNALTSTGEIQKGTALLREALEGGRRLRNGRLTAFALRALSLSSAENDCDYVTARRYASEALQVLEAMGATLTAAAAPELAEYEFAAGNPELAARQIAGQIAIIRAANMAPRIIVVRLCLLACYLNAAARFDEAEDCAREALDLSSRRDFEDLAPRALQCLAATAALRKQDLSKSSRETWTRAARILGFAQARLAALRAMPRPTELQECRRVIGVLQSAIGEAAVADAMTAGSVMTQEQAIDELDCV